MCAFLKSRGQVFQIHPRISVVFGYLFVVGGGILVYQAMSTTDVGDLRGDKAYPGNTSHLFQTLGWLSLLEGCLLLAPQLWFDHLAADDRRARSMTARSNYQGPWHLMLPTWGN